MNTLALGPSWLDPDYLLNTFGLPGLLLIVFAESGLLIGFFLPGDSLLFTTGLLVTTGDLKYPLWLVCVLVALAAIIGDQVGYLFGRKVGPALFKRPDSASSSRRTSRRPTSSSRSTARSRWCWPASCPSSGPSRRSSPV